MKLAFDKSTVRSYDKDGRLHISLANISKANVCPYLGSEIPGGEELGLDPKKIYQFLRDPQELEKAASTFNNLQLLYAHKPVHVNDSQKEITIGSTGTDASFEAPYLRNSLVIWDAEAIASVEDESQREISCAYHWVPDMTPGVYEGTAYDGRMTNIEGNHVALVSQGRAGSDVVVGDSIPEALKEMRPLSKLAMLVKGALLVTLPASKLAQDAKLDLDKILQGVNTANWKTKKEGIVAAIKPKLAADADLGSVIELLDKLDGEAPAEETPGTSAASPAPPETPAVDEHSEEDEEALFAQLKELLAKLKGSTPVTPAQDEEEEAGKKDGEEEKVSKPAMDAALAANAAKVEKDTIARIRAITAAEEEVKPYVGKLALTMDSAEEVYKAALTVLGVDVTGVHASAYRHILAAQPKAGTHQPILAHDSAALVGVSELFPNLYRLSH